MCFLGWQVQKWFYPKQAETFLPERTLKIEYANTYGTCGMCGAAMRTRQELPASIFTWRCIRGNIEIWY